MKWKCMKIQCLFYFLEKGREISRETSKEIIETHRSFRKRKPVVVVHHISLRNPSFEVQTMVREG